MTANQIAYWNMEYSNSLRRLELEETTRHNKANEDIGYKDLDIRRDSLDISREANNINWFRAETDRDRLGVDISKLDIEKENLQLKRFGSFADRTNYELGLANLELQRKNLLINQYDADTRRMQIGVGYAQARASMLGAQAAMSQANTQSYLSSFESRRLAQKDFSLQNDKRQLDQYAAKLKMDKSRLNMDKSRLQLDWMRGSAESWQRAASTIGTIVTAGTALAAL